MAAQAAMIEHEVHVVVFASESDTELAGFKTESNAEFEEEFLQVIQQGFFQLVLGVVRQFREAGEFEDVGIADEVFDGLLGLLTAGAFDDSGFVGGEAGALKEQGTDLALQLADRPVALQTFIFVESTFERIIQAASRRMSSCNWLQENCSTRRGERGVGDSRDAVPRICG